LAASRISLFKSSLCRSFLSLTPIINAKQRSFTEQCLVNYVIFYSITRNMLIINAKILRWAICIRGMIVSNSVNLMSYLIGVKYGQKCEFS
jgi:hypothetical protein